MIEDSKLNVEYTFNYFPNCKNQSTIKKNSENIDENEIYLWLSLLNNINYSIYLRLLKLFNSLKILYQISKDKTLFYNILINHSVFIPYKLFNDITNLKLKEKSTHIYNFLINNNYKIISINSKCYPHLLKDTLNPPLILCFKKDYDNYIEDILNTKKYCSIINKGKSKYGQKLNVDILKCLRKNHLCYIDLLLDNIENVVFKDIDISNDITKLDNLFSMDLNINKNNSEIIVYIGNYDVNEFLINLSSFILVIESGYSIYNLNLIDIALEKGADILTFPAGIYNNNFRLNNWLISQGAVCINSIKEFDKYLLEMSRK